MNPLTRLTSPKAGLPMLAALLLFLFGSTWLSGCGQKEEDMAPVQPGETEVYKDPVYKFSFKAPKSWVAESQTGKQTGYYSSQSAETRFQKYTEGDYGAKIEVGAYDGQTPGDALAAFKANIEGLDFGAPEATTLGGKPATKITFQQGKEANGYTGYRIFSGEDSLTTYFEAATWGERRMAKYRPVFELAQQSVTLAFKLRSKNGQLDSASQAAAQEEMKPAETFDTYKGDLYSLQYPSNFSTRAGSGGSVLIKGDRNDATLQVDVSPAVQGIDLEKYAAENAKKAYRGAAVSSTSLNGQPAKVVNYSFAAGVRSQAYFLMKGGKMFRVTVNWPAAMEENFKPALQKSVSTLKLK